MVSLVIVSHRISQVCCALYVLVASDLLERPELSALDNLTLASRFLADSYRIAEQQQHRDTLEIIMAFPERNYLRGSGFVDNALWSVIQAVSDADCYVNSGDTSARRLKSSRLKSVRYPRVGALKQ